jgi:hypothetical protein
MDAARLRAWWWQRQGLDGTLEGATAAEVLARSGWARSVAGASPYLSLFSRAGIGRAAADGAVAGLKIQELPGARGCTYVVPAADFALALAAGAAFGDGDMAQARKLGVTDKEIDTLCDRAMKALAKGPLDPDQLREEVGPAVRSLGDGGKKKGLTTTLPLALGRLQRTGEIRRIPTNGRLDQQRYRYARWVPNPLAGFRLSPGEVHVELARRYFAWIGVARVKDFQWFSALGVKASQAALEPLGLVPIEPGSDLLARPEDADAVGRMKVPAKPRYALVGSIDSLSLLRRDLPSLLEPADAARSVVADTRRCTLGGIADLPSHAILDRGRLVGLWEYDLERACIAWWPFVKKDRALEAAVARTEAFVRDELGDARAFSLDSPKSRALRIAALRDAS